MFFWGVAAHEDDVQVDENTDTGDALEYSVLKLLECLSCILESKWHAEKFQEAKWSNASCFAYVLVCHQHLTIPSG